MRLSAFEAGGPARQIGLRGDCGCDSIGAGLGKLSVCSGAISMFAKLGNFIYWIACTVAVLVVGLAALVWFMEREAGDLVMIFKLILIGLGAWIIGGGCRYVLARA